MKRIESILGKAEEEYNNYHKTLDEINSKTNLLFELTKKKSFLPMKLTIKLGWFDHYIVALKPGFTLRSAHIEPEPSPKNFIKILDYLLEELDETPTTD